MFKKLVTLLIIMALAVSATGCFTIGSIVGRGPVETQIFDFTGFTRIIVTTSFDVDIIQSNDFSVTVTTNQNLFEYLDLQQNGDTLKLQLRSGSYSFASLKAHITMPDIFSLEVSGASSGLVSNFNFTHSLALKATGASNIDLTNVKSGDIDMEISGASHINGGLVSANARFNISGASSVDLTGNGGALDVTASGASHATLKDFACGNIKVNFSTATSGSVNSGGRLDVQLSGASSLRYFGNPVLGEVNVSGGSSISKG